MLSCSKISGYVYCFFFRGDIIIAKSPFDPNMNICKRVIGLEGDKICTSSASALFKAHTYVSMFPSLYTSCEWLLYPGRFMMPVFESLWAEKAFKRW